MSPAVTFRHVSSIKFAENRFTAAIIYVGIVRIDFFFFIEYRIDVHDLYGVYNTLYYVISTVQLLFCIIDQVVESRILLTEINTYRNNEAVDWYLLSLIFNFNWTYDMTD